MKEHFTNGACGLQECRGHFCSCEGVDKMELLFFFGAVYYKNRNEVQCTVILRRNHFGRSGTDGKIRIIKTVDRRFR